MSADGWATCPRCRANGTIGMRGTEFREDWELGLNDPDMYPDGSEDGKDPCVILKYRGECQSCGLLVEIKERFPVTWEQPVNKPTGFVLRRPWSQIPAGWFVRARDTGPWYEVRQTMRHGDIQHVVLGQDGKEVGRWPRDPEQEVRCRRGSLAPEIQGATDALFSSFNATVIQDEVD